MTSRMKTTLWYPLAFLPLFALILWTVQGVGLTIVRVQGPSMVPTYADGQVLLVNRLAYGLQGPIIGQYVWIWKAPLPGDPVVVQAPERDAWVVKRVAGAPGMSLSIRDHSLTVGPRSIPLTPAQEYWLESCSQVPADSVFVVGDNQAQSLDSRDWGFVPLANVVGRSLF
jgi:signal peptidase I